MKAAGIICEYNPFHLGHARQLNLIRRELGDDTPIVCVMSGNYVQRGAPAMWDKFTRAEAATACGADLVLELPLTCVLQSAEGFAVGGVEILTKSGVASHISFGAECGDGQKLMDLAAKSLSEVREADLRRYLAEGLSYAAARQAALHDTEGVLLMPTTFSVWNTAALCCGSRARCSPLWFSVPGITTAQTQQKPPRQPPFAVVFPMETGRN